MISLLDGEQVEMFLLNLPNISEDKEEDSSTLPVIAAAADNEENDVCNGASEYDPRNYPASGQVGK